MTIYAYSVHFKNTVSKPILNSTGTQWQYIYKKAKEGLKPSTHNRYTMAGNWALQHFTEAEWKPYCKCKV